MIRPYGLERHRPTYIVVSWKLTLRSSEAWISGQPSKSVHAGLSNHSLRTSKSSESGEASCSLNSSEAKHTSETRSTCYSTKPHMR